MFRIKSVSIVLLAVFVTTCNRGDSGRNSNNLPREGTTQITGTGVRQSNGSYDSLRDPYHVAYLTDLSFREIGSLFLSDSITLTENSITFQMMDTLITCSDRDRDFFMSVFEKIVASADGALAEAVGSYTWRLINSHPEYFLHYLDTTEYEIRREWAAFTAYEMYSLYPADSLIYHARKLISNLNDSSNHKTAGLSGFEEELISVLKSLIVN